LRLFVQFAEPANLGPHPRGQRHDDDRPIPPLTTEATGPKKRATVPDSNSPSSLEALMNTLLTAETRPRFHWAYATAPDYAAPQR